MKNIASQMRGLIEIFEAIVEGQTRIENKLDALLARGAMPTPQQMPSEATLDRNGKRFLTQKELVKLTGWSRTTLWREINGGRFPEPIPTTSQRVGWLESEISEWHGQKIAERDTRHERSMGPKAKQAAAKQRLETKVLQENRPKTRIGGKR